MTEISQIVKGINVKVKTVTTTPDLKVKPDLFA